MESAEYSITKIHYDSMLAFVISGSKGKIIEDRVLHEPRLLSMIVASRDHELSMRHKTLSTRNTALAHLFTHAVLPFPWLM